jgi:hypothetical protein
LNLLQVGERFHPLFWILGLENEQFHTLCLEIVIADLVRRSDSNFNDRPLRRGGSREEHVPIRFPGVSARDVYREMNAAALVELQPAKVIQSHPVWAFRGCLELEDRFG